MIGKALAITGIGAIGTGVGALTGTYAAQQSNMNGASGAFMGGVTGMGVGVGASALVANSAGIASGIGSKVMSLGARAYDFTASGELGKAGVAALNSAKNTGLTIGGGALKTAGSIAPTASTMALKAGAKYGNIAASMFEINPSFLTKESGRMLNFSKTGKVVMGLGTIGAMGISGVKAFNQSKIGVSDGQVTSATPNASAYSSNMRNAGATGDLAFAMRAQRNG